MKIHRIILLAGILNISIISSFGQISSSTEKAGQEMKVSGDIFLDMNILSKKPVFIRGQLPYQSWSAGLNLQLEKGERIKINLLTAIGGGTPFDNPELYGYILTTQFNLNKKLGVVWGAEASYNINQIPVLDYAGRIPHTGLSNMYAGPKFMHTWNKKGYIKTETYAYKTIRGNTPVNNNGFTAPYIGWRVGNTLILGRTQNKRSFVMYTDTYLEGNNDKFIGHFEAVGISLKIDFLVSRHFSIQQGASIRRNIRGSPYSGTQSKSFNPSIGISAAPINNDVFMVWIGPRFVF
ncbi:MAG TPA: hypothetical protein VJH71_03345 [Candidatus Paceibacterota bacterium]